MIETYLDAGVLLAAGKGNEIASRDAINVIRDSNRTFVSSSYLRLETLALSLHFGYSGQAHFYEAFFADIVRWAEISEAVTALAFRESSKLGIKALDALHIASAYNAGAKELITAERVSSNMCRSTLLRVISIHSPEFMRPLR